MSSWSLAAGRPQDGTAEPAGQRFSLWSNPFFETPSPQPDDLLSPSTVAGASAAKAWLHALVSPRGAAPQAAGGPHPATPRAPSSPTALALSTQPLDQEAGDSTSTEGVASAHFPPPPSSPHLASPHPGPRPGAPASPAPPPSPASAAAKRLSTQYAPQSFPVVTPDSGGQVEADRLSSQAGLAKWIKLSSHLDSSFQLAGDSEPAGTQSAGHNPAAGTPTMGGTPRTTGGTPSAGGTPTTGSTPSAGGIPTTGGTPVSLQAPVPPPALESPVAPVGRQLAAAFQSAASPSGSPPAADGAAAGQPIPSEDRTHDSLPGRDGSSAAVNDNNSNNDDRQQPPANGRHGQPSADSSSNKAPTRTASRHAAGSRRAAAPAAPLLALLAVLLVVGTAGAAVALARHGVRIPIPSTIVPTQWAALDWQQHAAAAHCALRTAAGSARQRLVQQAASWQQAGQEQWVRVSAQAQAQWRSWQAAGLSGAKAGLAGAAYEASQAASEGLLALRASAAPAAAAARQRWRQLRATASWQQAAGALRRLSTAVARSHWGSRIWTVLSQAAKRLPIPAVPSSWLSMTWPQAATSSAASWLQQAASQGLLALRAGAAPTAAEVQKRWAELASSAAMGFQQATATLSEATPPAVSQALVALRANAAPGAAALQRRWRLVCLQLPPALRALLAPGAGPLAIMPAAEQAAVSAEAPPSTSPEQPTTPPALDASTVDTAPPLAATADAAPSPAPALLRGVHAAVLASPLLQGLHAALLASPLRTVGAATAAAACLSVALVLAVSWGRVAAARRALQDPAWQPFPTPTPVPGDRGVFPGPGPWEPRQQSEEAPPATSRPSTRRRARASAAPAGEAPPSSSRALRPMRLAAA